jgi:hypothetical protein
MGGDGATLFHLISRYTIIPAPPVTHTYLHFPNTQSPHVLHISSIHTTIHIARLSLPSITFLLSFLLTLAQAHSAHQSCSHDISLSPSQRQGGVIFIVGFIRCSDVEEKRTGVVSAACQGSVTFLRVPMTQLSCFFAVLTHCLGSR